MSKLRDSAAELLAETLRDGMTLAVGGFGLSGCLLYTSPSPRD